MNIGHELRGYAEHAANTADVAAWPVRAKRARIIATFQQLYPEVSLAPAVARAVFAYACARSWQNPEAKAQRDVKPENVPHSQECVDCKGAPVKVGTKIWMRTLGEKPWPAGVKRDVKQVRGFVDSHVVLREWWPGKQRWNYSCEHVETIEQIFEVRK